MKRVIITTLVTALLVLAAFSVINSAWVPTPGLSVVKVGFVYKNDESTPYTYNFMLAQDALEKTYGNRVQVITRSNVTEAETLEPLRELVREGCEIIFTNNNSEQMIEAAAEYPDVQFCQGAYTVDDHSQDPENYHSFAGAIYEGRYASGVVAGLKLRDMIDRHVITADEAVVGFVGAYPYADIISAYTAFFLGVRSVAPEATMRVRYVGAWNSYNKEKACAKALIEEGCLVIAQHTDTFGPAVACEEASTERKVFHVGYHQSAIDVAPGTSLVSTRTDWAPYVIGAVGAVMEGKEIEKTVPGNVFGHDMCAGFDEGWVDMTELNKQIVAYGTQEKLNKVIEGFQKGTIDVFKGDYVGVDPTDSSDTIDLNAGFKENAETSWPRFHYVLKDVITVDE